MLIILIIAICIAIAVYLNAPETKGARSEQELVHKLDKDSLWKQSGRTLSNVYIPKPSGDTSEIDAIYIARKGLLVLENKDYAGYIFGSETNRNWTVTLYAGTEWNGDSKVEKHQFYNPVWQNRTHIRYLKEYLGEDVKTFSLITFSDRGELKEINVTSPGVFVCNHANLSKMLKKIWNENTDTLTDKQIEEIYKKLVPLTQVTEENRLKHINDIQNRFSSTEICPVCGQRLVQRTAKRGANIGKQFLGCSNYPKCKYTRNVSNPERKDTADTR